MARRLGLEAHPGETTYPPAEYFRPKSQLFWRAYPLPADLFQCPQSRTATLGPLILTKAWLYIESSPCRGVRPAGDPVDSDPRAVFWARSPPWIKGSSLAGAPSVSPHPGADGLVQGGHGGPVPWILTVFTSLACYPGAPLTATETRLAWAGTGEDCRSPHHVPTTYPCG